MDILTRLHRHTCYERWAPACTQAGYNPEELLCALLALECLDAALRDTDPGAAPVPAVLQSPPAEAIPTEGQAGPLCPITDT